MDKEEKPMEGVTITMYGASSSTKTDATRHFERHSPKFCVNVWIIGGSNKELSTLEKISMVRFNNLCEVGSVI